jgi:hypothetical protein
MAIIKKTMGDNNKNWGNKIKLVLWADKVTKKEATGKIPFELVYRMDVKLPIHFKIPMYQLLQHFTTNKKVVHVRVNQLVELKENQQKAFNHLVEKQEKVKGAFDKIGHPRVLQKGDLVLMRDKKKEKRGKHNKFDSL